MPLRTIVDDDMFTNNHSKCAVLFHFNEPLSGREQTILASIFAEVLETKWRDEFIASAAELGITLTPRTI